VRKSIETRYYVTDLTNDASIEHLFRLVHGHWSIENGIIRHTTYRSVNIAAATRHLARQPDIALDLLGIPRGLCN
jgi:hypothetical protein